jgi:ATP-dependent DNA ligase
VRTASDRTGGLPPGFIEPCIPTLAAKPPSGPDWVHEIKHDGYQLIVRRDGKVVQLFTRRGYNWTDRYPAIAAVASACSRRHRADDREAEIQSPSPAMNGLGLWYTTRPPPQR